SRSPEPGSPPARSTPPSNDPGLLPQKSGRWFRICSEIIIDPTLSGSGITCNPSEEAPRMTTHRCPRVALAVMTLILSGLVGCDIPSGPNVTGTPERPQQTNGPNDPG